MAVNSDRVVRECLGPSFDKFFYRPVVGTWYVSNVSIIFDAPCLFIHHLLCVLLHFVAFLCIFRN
jgi:hypothetical protein